jgi:FlaA1/EpsC-like NDP-sugar epimerase
MLTKKGFTWLLIDSAAWVTAIWISALLRFDGQLPVEMNSYVWQIAFLSVTVFLIVGTTLSLYTGKYRRASLEETQFIGLSVFISTVILFSIRILSGFSPVPRSLPVIAGFLALVFILMTRILTSPQRFRPYKNGSTGERALIYGVGIAGRQLAEQLLKLPGRYDPIGFLDDDKSTSNLRIFGRPVFGTISELEKVVRAEAPSILIIAIADIQSADLLDIERRCRKLEIALRIIPSPHDIISGTVSMSDIQEISEEDLLGRRIVSTNDASIAEFIRGKRVLVTGAGGSIGSEISRQVYQYSPETLVLLDRDETALLNLQLSLDGTGLLTNNGLILGDIRDKERIEEIFAESRPTIVFHAAALKHLTTLERFPEEATKTNVIGTRNVLIAAVKNEVETFVNISTDKAADPSSALGRSKLLTERLTAGINGVGKKYISVRFGNVIGSNGSFIHTFRHQIRHGGPVTITHPEVSRFFMTVSEAVHLVLQSAVLGKHGETMILDMGEPVSIDVIAKRMIAVSGKNIKIKYTGLRDGEKLHEALIAPDEKIEVRENQFIMHTRVEPLTEFEYLP